jgi:hypothetical protein
MTKRQYAGQLAAGFAIVVLLTTAMGWWAFGRRIVNYGEVVSWEQLPVPHELFADLAVEGKVRAVLVTHYRYDELYVQGQAHPKAWETFAARYDHVFLSTESHASLPNVLTEASDRLHLSGDIVEALADANTWFIHGGLNNGIHITARYDPRTGNYLASISLEHGWRKK